jgi:putative peptide zinc metalloprotease protein
MNLSEALDAALPEIPKVRLSRARPPRLDPELVTREDVLDGEPVVGILQRSKGSFFRFQPPQWQLAQLFDGIRSYDEIAQRFNEEQGGALTAREVEEFATSLDEAGFWFKTPQEKNMAYSARLRAERGRKANRTSKINFAHISFTAWDPDKYLTWLDGMVGRFIYSRWCVLAVVLLFCFEGLVFAAKWKDFGPDIPLYYNFTHKTFADFAEFWVLLFGLGFIHESAHGLTCKHYGGEVHNMGLMFLYLTPAFFVDVTETWVSATKIQRLATIIAGIWVEMVVCGLAMIVWTNTQPSAFVHDLAYKVILITGLAVIVMNLNPLLKLDGYYFLTELIGIPDLKERSTSFVSAWFQRSILRLPAEVPSVPRRRAPLFLVYAVVSGAYSYMVLFLVIRFSYNVGSKFVTEFALIPAGAMAIAIFRGRLKSLAGVAQQFWKTHLSGAFWMQPRTLGTAFVLVIVLFAPVLRDRENAYFVVEASDPVTLHAPVNGKVEAVYVREGDAVRRGQPLLRLSSADVAGMTSSSQAAIGSARYHAVEAQLGGRSIGASAAEETGARRSAGLADEAQASLVVRAKVDGRVLTPQPDELVDQQVGSGEALLTLAGDGSAEGKGEQRLRLYIPAGEMNRIQPGDEVAVAPPGRFTIVRMRLASLEGEPATLPAGLIPHQDYKGIELPTFYGARMALPVGSPRLALGTVGVAKVFGARRSLAARIVEVVVDVVRAHVW